MCVYVRRKSIAVVNARYRKKLNWVIVVRYTAIIVFMTGVREERYEHLERFIIKIIIVEMKKKKATKRLYL